MGAGAGKGRGEGVDRRSLLGAGLGAAAGAAAGAATSVTAEAQQGEAGARAGSGSIGTPSDAQLARDAGNVRPPDPTGRAVVRPGSDVMVEVLRGLEIEFVASNPGSSFEGLQESIVNHGDPPNRMPEFITALHEESAVDMAHGYGKAEGRPMAALVHGVLGVQHASMAIYQAYCDQTPILVLAGRDDGFIQDHTADDMAGLVRAFTKWDAQPTTLEGCVEALHEAYRQAMTPPRGPVLVVLDTELQKQEARGVVAPAFAPAVITGIEPHNAREIARGLVEADNPRIEVGKLRTPEGVAHAVELAELVGASTATAATRGPMSFPQRHPSCGPGAGDPDYALGLETMAASAAIVGPPIRDVAALRDVTRIGFGGMRVGGPSPFGGPARRADVVYDADAEASLPAIIDAARGMIDGAKASRIAMRKSAHAEANRKARVDALANALEQKRIGWNSSPVSLARIYAELWPLIKDEDWCLASPSAFTGSHHVELWDHDKPYSYLGPQGAGGIGVGLGSSVGAGLAARSRGRIVINIQADGDINFVPGSLWTAAHHRVPMLAIMHNNRAWHQELMFLEYMAGVRGRGTDRASIGSSLRDPAINYAKMAEAYGVESEGPIEDPGELAAAFARGVAVVKQGRPYLIDVVCQPR